MNARPIKRSSVHYLLAEHNARFVTQHGWEVASTFGDAAAEKSAAAEGVAIADISWYGQIESKGPWAASVAAQAIAGAVVCPVTPERTMFVVEPQSIDAVRSKLESLAAGQPRAYVIDVSSVYGGFELIGPRYPDLLCKVSSAQPQKGKPIFAPAAGVRCLMIRTDRGLQLHFQREFGTALWETLVDAGREFKIRPVGVEV
jgi:glycine cleavage system aminomethyltransferase T